MAEQSKIEWTDATWNPITGCPVARFNKPLLDQPIQWERPHKILVCEKGDLFHERTPYGWIDQAFAVMSLTPRHTFHIFTKRPDVAFKYFAGDPWHQINAIAGAIMHLDKMPEAEIPLPNVWLSVSIDSIMIEAWKGKDDD